MDATAIRTAAAESAAVKKEFFEHQAQALADLGARLAAAVSSGARVLSFGNGGSAADAQHFAAELIGRFQKERRALPAMALTTDPSVMTALANDLGYEAVFERQLEAHGREGDVALAISTSGRSPNVLQAVRAARSLGMLTVGLTGGGGGELAGLVDELIDVPSSSTQRIQEVHVMVIHMLCEAIEEAAAR